jgi:hypothetical protein
MGNDLKMLDMQLGVFKNTWISKFVVDLLSKNAIILYIKIHMGLNYAHAMTLNGNLVFLEQKKLVI